MLSGAVALLHAALPVSMAVGLTMWVVGVPSSVMGIYCVVAFPLGVVALYRLGDLLEGVRHDRFHTPGSARG